ncbi:MAG: hypothetical protein R3C11_29590, partial [Planctomycetaceae bacterium]
MFLLFVLSVVVIYSLIWFISRPMLVRVPQVLDRNESGDLEIDYHASWGLAYLPVSTKRNYETDYEFSIEHLGDFAMVEKHRIFEENNERVEDSIVESLYMPDSLYFSERRIVIYIHSHNLLMQLLAKELVNLCNQYGLGETIEIYFDKSERSPDLPEPDMVIELFELAQSAQQSDNLESQYHVRLYTSPAIHPLGWDIGHSRRLRQFDLNYLIRVQEYDDSMPARARLEILSEQLRYRFASLFTGLGKLQKLRHQLDERQLLYQPALKEPPEFKFLQKAGLELHEQTHGYLKPNQTLWNLGLTPEEATSYAGQIETELTEQGWHKLPTPIGVSMAKGNDRLLFVEARPYTGKQNLLQRFQENPREYHRFHEYPLDRAFQFKRTVMFVHDENEFIKYHYKKWFHLEREFERNGQLEEIHINGQSYPKSGFRFGQGGAVVEEAKGTMGNNSRSYSGSIPTGKTGEKLRELLDNFVMPTHVPDQKGITDYEIHYLDILEESELNQISRALQEQNATLSELLMFGDFIPADFLKEQVEQLEQKPDKTTSEQLTLAGLYAWEQIEDRDRA